MWQRFTERARRVILLGQEEAGRMNSGHVGTEHLLLGLVRENDSVGTQILVDMGVNRDAVRQEVETANQPSEPSNYLEPKLTPRAKRVLELAADEARLLRHNYIGTEHLLLALLREKDGLAATILQNFGLELKTLRQKVLDYASLEAGTEAVPFLVPTNTESSTIAPTPVEIEAKIPRPVSSLAQTTSNFRLTPEAMILLLQAATRAKQEEKTLLSPRHLLMAIVEDSDGEAAKLLQNVGLDLEKARTALGHLSQGSSTCEAESNPST